MCLSAKARMRLLLLMVVVVVVTESVLPPPERSYNILIVLTVSGTSHRNVFIPVAEGLADRGHKVYVLSSLANFTTDRNITQLNTGINVMEDVKINTFDILEDNFDEFNYLMTLLPKLIDDVYASPIFMELYNKRKMFDLIIIDHMFNELNYPFTHEIPFITIATHGMDPLQSAAVFGNVLNPAYTPSVFFSLSPPKGLYQRFTNTLIHLLVSFTYNYWTVIPVIQKKVSAKFPDAPPLLEMARNQSLTLINSHFSLVMPYPLLPSQVEVGALHCRPGQPLPQDISSWIEGAGEAGIVYFSLGSITKGALMPEKYLKLFLQAFKRLDQRVLWKFESDLPGVPDNILIRPWMPQQDILSHPGVKVFMSHGGLLGTQEALYHAKPILALPIHGDQPRNAQNIVDKGLGLSLNWKELSVDRIVHTIQEIINNPRYKRRMQEVSSALRDQPQSPRERAVFWTEYVIRHQGAPQLRCPAVELSWVEFLMLDVLALILLAAVIALFALRRIITFIWGRIVKQTQSKHKYD